MAESLLQKKEALYEKVKHRDWACRVDRAAGLGYLIKRVNG
jgi:hypothetical protein